MTQLTLSVNDLITAAPGASCDADLARGPWDFDLAPGYGPGASELDVIPEPVTRPGQLPTAYQRMGDDELHARIRAAKEKLGNDLVILGHFYQRDEVVQYADFVGDSFQLANAALTRPEASTIVFCGVHFMSETADFLARPEQHDVWVRLRDHGHRALHVGSLPDDGDALPDLGLDAAAEHRVVVDHDHPGPRGTALGR